MVSIDLAKGEKYILDRELRHLNKFTGCGEYILALDPSSSQTGFCIGTEDKRIVLIGDIKNISGDRFSYNIEMKSAIRRLFKEVNISKFVYEVSFNERGSDIVSSVLRSVEKTLSDMQESLDSLKNENMYPILPAVWRKNFLKDKKYDGMRRERDKLKKATLQECISRNPEFKNYWELDKYYIPDSVDAVGVYYGFIEEYWYDFEKKIKNVSKVNSRYNRNHNYTYELLKGSFQEICTEAKYKYEYIDFSDIYSYNEKLSLKENIMIVTAQSNTPKLIFALTKNSYKLLRFDILENLSDSDMIAVLAVRGNI